MDDMPPQAPETERPLRRFWLRQETSLRQGFFNGILVLTPVAVTVWFTVSIVSWIDASMMPLLPRALHPETYLGFHLPGVGLLFALFLVTLAGVVLANVMGLTAMGAAERLVERMPVVRAIYKTTQEVTGTLLTRSDASFQQVGLIEFPRPGAWAICFITSSARGIVGELLPSDVVSVFIPTTPNPTTGFLLYVERRSLRVLDISVEDAMKLIISAGLVGPDLLAGPTASGVHSLVTRLKKSFDMRLQPNRKRG